jgi:two-component system sensor histidine kinase KdpD
MSTNSTKPDRPEHLRDRGERGIRIPYSPLTSRENVIAVIAILSTKDLPPISKETENFLQLIFSQFVMVLERQHLEDDRQMIVMEQQKERMRGNLLRAISHDLRTPLTGIIGASSAILDNRGKIDAQDMFHLVSDINTDAMWLLRMVENVLSVTRFDNEAATKLHKSTEPIEEVVSQAVQKPKKHFPACKLQVKVPDEFIMAYMDSTLIEQVVINLIENAIRHSESTEPIEVSVEVSDDNHCSSPSETTERHRGGRTPICSKVFRSGQREER